MPEENFWTLWCTGRLTEADTKTIRLGATPSNQCPPPPSPHIFTGQLPFLPPIVSKHWRQPLQYCHTVTIMVQCLPFDRALPSSYAVIWPFRSLSTLKITDHKFLRIWLSNPNQKIQKHTHSHNCLQPFSETTQVSRCQKKSSSGLYGAREDNRGRHTNNPDGCHCIGTNQWPTSIIPLFSRQMPFLPQSSQFILACDRH